MLIRTLLILFLAQPCLGAVSVPPLNLAVVPLSESSDDLKELQTSRTSTEVNQSQLEYDVLKPLLKEISYALCTMSGETVLNAEDPIGDAFIAQGQNNSVYRVVKLDASAPSEQYAAIVTRRWVDEGSVKLETQGDARMVEFLEKPPAGYAEPGKYFNAPFLETMVFFLKPGRYVRVAPLLADATLVHLINAMIRLANDGFRSEEQKKLTLHIGAQLFMGLEMLHAAGLVHRDIKPSNIGKSGDGDYKFFDYSEMASEADGLLDAYVGTNRFHPPDFYPDNGGNIGRISFEQAKAHDVYALGVTLYYLYFGHYPLEYYSDRQRRKMRFPVQTAQEMRKAIRYRGVQDAGPETAFEDFLGRYLTHPEWTKRPTAEQARLWFEAQLEATSPREDAEQASTKPSPRGTLQDLRDLGSSGRLRLRRIDSAAAVQRSQSKQGPSPQTDETIIRPATIDNEAS